MEQLLKQTVRYFKKNNQAINENFSKLKFEYENLADQFKRLDSEY